MNREKKEISDIEKWLDCFDTKQHESLRTVWEESEHAVPEHPEVSTEEVDEALAQVHRRLDKDKKEFAPRTGWTRIAAAAAVILLAIGYFLIPQKETASRGQMSSVELPDGSQVELNSDTEISYNRLFGVTHRNVKLDGEAFFSVVKGSKSFRVLANQSAVEVAGTEFNVRSWSNDPAEEVEVAVTEGSVRFYPEGEIEQAVMITPGEFSRLSLKMEKPASPVETEVDRLTGWRDQMLIFNSKPLAAIFRELERRFDVEIRLEVEEFAIEKLTAYYTEPQDVESVLEDITRVKGLRFAPTANGYRVYR